MSGSTNMGPIAKRVIGPAPVKFAARMSGGVAWHRIVTELTTDRNYRTACGRDIPTATARLSTNSEVSCSFCHTREMEAQS